MSHTEVSGFLSLLLELWRKGKWVHTHRQNTRSETGYWKEGSGLHVSHPSDYDKSKMSCRQSCSQVWQLRNWNNYENKRCSWGNSPFTDKNTSQTQRITQEVSSHCKVTNDLEFRFLFIFALSLVNPLWSLATAGINLNPVLPWLYISCVKITLIIYYWLPLILCRWIVI